MSGTALVVGGGIAGLVAAHRLSTAGWDVTLAEATSVLGGAVSPRFLDVPSHGETGAPETQTLELDGGAESFAVRGAAVRALLEELGLGEKIVAPEPLGSWLHGPAGPVRAPVSASSASPATSTPRTSPPPSRRPAWSAPGRTPRPPWIAGPPRSRPASR